MKVKRKVKNQDENVSSNKNVSYRAELDSHADQCCVGRTAMILSTHSKKVDVKPFLEKLGTVNNVPIVSAAIVYDNPMNGHPIVLIIHQALYFKDMKHILLCPMQIRLNDIYLDECPKFLQSHPTQDHHCLKLEDLRIPLSIHGCSSYFPFRSPTTGEYNHALRYELTSPDPEWDPRDSRYSDEEEKLIERVTGDEEYKLAYSRMIFAVAFSSPEEFLHQVMTSVITIEADSNVDKDQSGIAYREVSALMTEKAKFRMTPEQLSRTWGIGLPIAKKTLEQTTQKGVRSTMYPTIERRWPTGDRPLRYRRLQYPVFHDTLKSNVKSLRGNKMAEIYATDFCWSRIFPMKKEADVHETLDLFLNRYGVPESLVSDGAKAYIGGKFKAKAREAGCYCKLTDPYSPWQNRAESEIREVKRLAGRWMVKAKSPR